VRLGRLDKRGLERLSRLKAKGRGMSGVFTGDGDDR